MGKRGSTSGARSVARSTAFRYVLARRRKQAEKGARQAAPSPALPPAILCIRVEGVYACGAGTGQLSLPPPTIVGIFNIVYTIFRGSRNQNQSVVKNKNKVNFKCVKIQICKIHICLVGMHGKIQPRWVNHGREGHVVPAVRDGKVNGASLDD